MEQQKKTGMQLAMRVSAVSIIGNVLLSAFKLFAGIIAHSGAMISDAVHSLSDVLSTFIVIVGVKLSGKESDAKHQYGHERIECVAAILLAVMLAITGIGIGYSGVMKIIDGVGGDPAIPGTLALIAAIVSIAVKEAMFWYTRGAAKKIDSGALMADAWHHRSDALSSVGSFVGILGARLGLPVLDPIASVVICLFIIKAAYDIFKDAIRKMTDEACDDHVVEEIKHVSLAQEGVLGIDQIQTRIFGNRIYVDIEICADGTVPLRQSHGIAQQVHDAIETAFPAVKHCMVHVNPKQTDETAAIHNADKTELDI
jgi:cation diffusion facilitator family transporter